MCDPVLLNPDDFDDWPGLLDLLQQAFAFMQGRIDPPSSLADMTSASLKQKAKDEDLFLILRKTRPVACLFGRPDGQDYYIGKLAVANDARGQGLARLLIDAAARQARHEGCSGLRLQTRVELRENHRTFRAMGFHLIGASAHPGYARATSLTFRRPL
ncbi:GNAT family N-acetyltransferase [Nioella ostreopsis]|uniref:GNAT family N-acetyltransferase n=1 Tax=Nioella ostreopsis TaxID=2448479 RepID=UPI000FD8BDCA|nr:GNAT family N-acetyltransferase [Nioella ostreopsis]